MYNRMSDVVNKIERRLGTAPLGLPDELSKERWPDQVIIPDTLTTFSRFFPYKIDVALTKEDKDRTGEWYLLDKHIPDNLEVLGVGDIEWDQIQNSHLGINHNTGCGIYNILERGMDMDSILMAQQYADVASLFNSTINVVWDPPNRVRLDMALNTNLYQIIEGVKIAVYVKHPSNLMTIEPTKMETFENLATSDVALWLFQYLKHFEGIENSYATVNLKLDELEQQANKRQEIVDFLRENYVNPANTHQPIMYTV